MLSSFFDSNTSEAQSYNHTYSEFGSSRKPATQYTKSGRINIAYQVFGTGSVDLVYIPGWVSNIDWMWACPELVNFLTELGKMYRVVLFDKRGTGLSDRVVELSTLEERMDDIRAVMDAIGSEKAVLFGHSEGGSVSALFAATYPQRTLALITFGVFAKRRYAPEYPWAPTDEERQKVYDMIETSWGSGGMYLDSLAPSRANDMAFMEWLANYFRSGASPSAAMVLTKMNTDVDIIDILDSIKVPTLLMQRTHDIDVKIEEGRFIANRIKGAKLVEFEGNDHLFWAGNTREILREMYTFMGELNTGLNYEERLFTIVAAHYSCPPDLKTQMESAISQIVSRYRGNIIDFGEEAFVATFDGPSKGTHCSLAIMEAMRGIGVKLAIGIHIKEAAVNEALFLSGKTQSFIELVLQQALPNQILITQAVKFLLSGAGLHFAPYKTIHRNDLQDQLSLYMITDQPGIRNSQVQKQTQVNAQNESLLEDVLETIDTHLSNEQFGVEMLCREVGISERQLQRKLKAITNKSPNQLISSVRLHRAKELMMLHEDNIAEIAYKTGFSNPSYFSKCFKKEFGMCPSELQDTSEVAF
ncbi:alpha/beta fold hydrolase [Fulvivirga maritima]|uniref:alpha/beta fold hydrolase n=1 Tax=Fulvivirga maritima TaxID=2904247 RepID=UPI001F173F27|nr:alpha/beta fold hydrolase [Fulvivirga maritima]UII25866.1 alpha/beta fold hydrolase [Fulvivirga maritima]